MIHYGDCLDVMAEMESDSIDLIITSPPYADARKHTYGGVSADDYVEWFLPRAEQMYRVLKPSGSFVLNIKEKCVDGERHIYVLELITLLKLEIGFRWVEEYIWRKTCTFPGRWRTRLRDGWERLLHFTITDQFKMRQESVKKPTAPATIKRSQTLSDNDYIRVKSSTNSGFDVIRAQLGVKDQSLPDNVLEVAPVTYNKGHSAAFPDAIPEFFIRLFTDENDVVLDPFLGSGTTYKVAQKLNRRAIGIEILEEYAPLHAPDPQRVLL